MIYGLVDSDTLELRYIGKTIGSAEGRLRGHLANARRHGKGQRRLGCWIRSLVTPPSVIILERNSLDDDAAERRWIAEMRGLDARLCNMTDGGDGTPGHCHSEETKRRIGRSLRARPWVFTPGRQAAVARHIGMKRGEDTRRRISERARARGFSLQSCGKRHVFCAECNPAAAARAAEQFRVNARTPGLCGRFAGHRWARIDGKST